MSVIHEWPACESLVRVLEYNGSFSDPVTLFFCFFFFSSRRRHTRCGRDWSSDVCSSDLSFMAGQDTRYVAQLNRRMREAAETQDYESAARFRDQVAALETVLSKNTIVLADNVDADVFGIAHDELAAAVQLFKVRGGRIRGVRSWVVDKELDLDLAELVESVLRNAYDGDEVPARQVVVPVMPEDGPELEHWLASLKWERTGNSGRISLRVAQRGDVAALAQTVDTNAKNALMLYKTRRSSDFTARSQALADLQEALGMEEAPLRMECFDVSHLSGTNIVASMVVFEDGLPRKDQYRRFSIPASADDTDSIYQTLTRRLARLDDDPATSSATDPSAERLTLPEPVEGQSARPKFAYRPNLLIVDGGQPQVQAAARALADAGVTGIQLCGIAKRLEEVWLPDSDYPVILPRNSDAMFLILRIRDEAHRFAISYQRQRRKKDVTSVLSEVPGVGPSRVRELLRHFGSVTRLRAAAPEEIAEVKGIGTITATTIHRALRE